MSITGYKKWLLGGGVALASLLPFGNSSAQAAESASRVPVTTLMYRGDAASIQAQEVRWGRGWGRGYYGAPDGAYFGPRGYYPPRYSTGYRGGYYAPYGGYYGRGYYGPGHGYYRRGYYGGGVRVGGLGIFSLL